MRTTPYEDRLADDWDTFCLENSRAWFWHTSFRMRHALNSSFKISSRNASFLVEDEGSTVAVVPLTIDDHDLGEEGTLRRMSYGGGGVPAPVVADSVTPTRRQKILKMIFTEIDRIAQDEGVKDLHMRLALDPAVAAESVPDDMLPRAGQIDRSQATRIVALSADEDAIFRDFDENHRRAVKKADGVLEVSVLSGEEEVTREEFDRFQEFYFKAAGGKTRPQETFELLFDYLRAGTALLGVARHQGRPVGYTAVIRFKDSAYYLMGAGEDGFDLCPIAHSIHWAIMKRLKADGIRFYETGLQEHGPGLFQVPTPKQVNISRFKRGFGGVSVPAPAGEKFYDATHLEAALTARVRALVEAMSATPERST